VDRTIEFLCQGKVQARFVPGVILNPTPDKQGYLLVKVSRRLQLVHRLVATHFLPPPKPHQTVVMHRDDTPGNNHWKNLRWGTQKDNVVDMANKGRQAWTKVYKIGKERDTAGEANASAKLTNEKVKAIVAEVVAGASYSRAGRGHGVSRVAVMRIMNGLTWSHVTGIARQERTDR